MARARAKDHDDKRAAILKAAATVFARDGYDRASMAGLAVEYGVSKALLYHYYASKEALLFDVIRAHLEKLVESVEAADRPDLPPEERLGALVSALLDSYRDADCEHKVQLTALNLLPPGEQERLKSMERRLVGIFSEAVRALRPEAFENGATLKPVTMSLFGMLNWAYLWLRDTGPVSREDYARLVTTLIAGGVSRLSR
ncbi:MAG: TetR/AcrR family transcriptional regulator [Rhizobiaceae bacterium]|nr:TetR/AcrR family transcriptional regulator [Rhizobiaceae bacterium]MCV0409151.1 TetR/AcrR family transcriptional regulator [Rhizobiaceae bacterium]